MKFKEVIDFEVNDGIGILTIQGPQGNVLSVLMRQALAECIETIKGDDSLRVLIVTGSGKFFVAGADVKEFETLDAPGFIEFARNGQSLLAEFEKMRIPVIAAVNGYAFGGGLEVALACDIRLASSKAMMGLPETTLGILPGFGGLSRLPLMVGEGNAKRIIFTGKPFDANEALRIGLVQEVVDPDELMNRALELAKEMAASAKLSIAKCKAGIHKRRDCTLEQSFENEALYAGELFFTEDRKTRISAFVNKSK